MPFTSKKQARWAFATGQPWAEDWASKTDFSTLPTSANDRYEDGDEVQKLGLKDLSKYYKYRKNTKLKDKISNSLRDVLFNPNNQFEVRTNPMEKAHSMRYARNLPLDIGAALYGSIPIKKNPYYTGFVGGNLNKQFGDFNLGLGVERELLSGKTKLKPNIRYTKRFDEGGHVHPHSTHSNPKNIGYTGNRTTFTGNIRKDDYINKMLMEGRHSYNPETGALELLDTPISEHISEKDKKM